MTHSAYCLHLLLCIQRAQASGFVHLAAALRTLLEEADQTGPA